jgi:hypothetical protein
MKTYILDIIPKIQKFSKKLDDITLLSNQHWVLMDSIGGSKTVLIFRLNNELLVSVDGKVNKGKWEYLGNNSILIDLLNESFLYKHGFFDENVLALKSDNKNEFALLINENRFEGELNSVPKLVQFLEEKYLSTVQKKIPKNKQKKYLSIVQKKTPKNKKKVIENGNEMADILTWILIILFGLAIFAWISSYA